MDSKKILLQDDIGLKFFAITAFILIVVWFIQPYADNLYLQGNDTSNSTAKVCFNSTCVDAEIADTPASRERGLMFREHLDEDKGMIFIFEQDGYTSFWMKNTLIPLDMIWIDSGMKVIHIETAEPCKIAFCPTYQTLSPAKYVLEVNSRFAKRNGIIAGSLATFSKM